MKHSLYNIAGGFVFRGGGYRGVSRKEENTIYSANVACKKPQNQ